MNAYLSGTRTGAWRRLAGWLTLVFMALAGGQAMAQSAPPPAPPMLMPPAVPAGQAAQAGPPERWLLIFDSSSAMKKRLPALDGEINLLFGSNMGDHLHAGDSVGVWTFDNAVHAGDYPLMTWQPENAAGMATNLMKFVRKQDFHGVTDFSALQDLVNRVIATSERLTIVIFCDGEGEVHWTPYDEGINENLKEGAAERKKSRLPVVMVVRTQQGKYIGATVNYPPAGVTIPPFPPLAVKPPTTPPPPPLVVHPAPAPAPRPVVELPPLIIVGKSEGTDVTATARFEATNVVPKVDRIHINPGNMTVASAPAPASVPQVVPVTNEATPPAETQPVTNAVASVPVNTVTPTNAVAGTTDANADRGAKLLLAIAAAFFGVAIILVIWLATRRRRPTASLITSLMSDDPRFRK